MMEVRSEGLELDGEVFDGEVRELRDELLIGIQVLLTVERKPGMEAATLEIAESLIKKLDVAGNARVLAAVILIVEQLFKETQ